MTGLEVKEFRKKYNLSQFDLAEIIGTGIRAVQGWEQNQRKVSQSAIKLMQAYDANISKNEKEGNNHFTETSSKSEKENELLLLENNFLKEQLKMKNEALSMKDEMIKAYEDTLSFLKDQLGKREDDLHLKDAIIKNMSDRLEQYQGKQVG